MKIVTYNVNGIRSAMNKGFTDFLKAESPDIVCLQELKAQERDIDEKSLHDLGYHCYWYPAEKKGYSGVGILSKTEPLQVEKGMGHPLFDHEGRIITAHFKDFQVMSCYFPSGTTGDIRQKIKYEFLDAFYEFIHGKTEAKDKLVICGDYNIAHKPIDIHDPVGNKNSSGFLPEEREWMDKWFGNGMLDSLRHLNPEPDIYTWWSFRTNARSRNKGWRIDYISISNSLKKNLKSAGVYGDWVHSDHCGSYACLENL